MDIISHGLWTVAAGKFAEKKFKKPLNAWLLAWWGIFPDLFAFTIPFIWIFVELVSGRLSFSSLPRMHEGEPPSFTQRLGIFGLASSLYNISHSLFIFAGAFLLVFWMLRRVPWEMFGWLLHIMIDIPTHPFNIFPTPLFWPFFGWKFTHGFSWASPWFLALDAVLLVTTYAYLWRGKAFGKHRE